MPNIGRRKKHVLRMCEDLEVLYPIPEGKRISVPVLLDRFNTPIPRNEKQSIKVGSGDSSDLVESVSELRVKRCSRPTYAMIQLSLFGSGSLTNVHDVQVRLRHPSLWTLHQWILRNFKNFLSTCVHYKVYDLNMLELNSNLFDHYLNHPERKGDMIPLLVYGIEDAPRHVTLTLTVQAHDGTVRQQLFQDVPCTTLRNLVERLASACNIPPEDLQRGYFKHLYRVNSSERVTVINSENFHHTKMCSSLCSCFLTLQSVSVPWAGSVLQQRGLSKDTALVWNDDGRLPPPQPRH